MVIMVIFPWGIPIFCTIQIALTHARITLNKTSRTPEDFKSSVSVTSEFVFFLFRSVYKELHADRETGC